MCAHLRRVLIILNHKSMFNVTHYKKCDALILLPAVRFIQKYKAKKHIKFTSKNSLRLNINQINQVN